jgi:hypothetical protein
MSNDFFLGTFETMHKKNVASLIARKLWSVGIEVWRGYSRWGRIRNRYLRP